MFLCLEKPGLDKGMTLFVRELAGESAHQRQRAYGNGNSERNRANRAVEGAAAALEKAGLGRNLMFNQHAYTGTTGWEYFSPDQAFMLRHALLVAAALALPLHLHNDVIDIMVQAAIHCGITFTAQAAQSPEKGDYLVLVEVQLPSSMPSAPSL